LELSQESRQRLVSAFEEIPSGYAAIGQAIEERRAKWEEMVSNQKELSEAQRASWFKIISFATDHNPRLEEPRGYLDLSEVSEKERVHLWLHGVSEDPEWTKKRTCLGAFNDLEAKSNLNSAVNFPEQCGSLNDFKQKVSEVHTVIAHVIPALRLHGYPIEKWEEELPAVRHLDEQDSNKKDKLQMADQEATAQDATSIPHGVDAIKNLPTNFPLNDPDKAANALKDWVKPKWTSFDVKDGCPHIIADGDMMTLLPSRYSPTSPMNEDLGKRQVCYFCRTAITMIQEMCLTPYGTDWNTQTDNINHALTVLCDRIAEINSSPHWQSDCKNFVEFWGPEILCTLENAGEKMGMMATRKAPEDLSPTGKMGVHYEIAHWFTQLSGEVCQRYQMTYNVLDGSGVSRTEIREFCFQEEVE